MPDAVAIVTPDGIAITYRALDRCIDRMTGHAAALGLRAGDIAALTIAPPDQLTALTLALGLVRMGVAIADPNAPPGKPRLRFQAGGRAPRPGRVSFDASWMLTEPVGLATGGANAHADPEALCCVFASSGTTGEPKHVPVSHALMTRRVFGLWLGLSGGRETRMIAIGLGGALGFKTVLRTIWAGGTVVLFEPALAATAIARHGVTSIVGSPFALRTILDLMPAEAGPFPSLKTIEFAGSSLPGPLYERIAARLCPTVISDFGSAEADHFAAAPVAALESRPGAVGYLSPASRFRPWTMKATRCRPAQMACCASAAGRWRRGIFGTMPPRRRVSGTAGMSPATLARSGRMACSH